VPGLTQRRLATESTDGAPNQDISMCEAGDGTELAAALAAMLGDYEHCASPT